MLRAEARVPTHGVKQFLQLAKIPSLRRTEANPSMHDRNLRVPRSVELNLSPDGAGDIDGKNLRMLDLVLGCCHSALRRNEDQTEPYLAAFGNPSIHILGDPRGRIYNVRVGLRADWSRVFATAAHLDKAVELDCYPDRQDLNLGLLRLAKREGCRTSIGTDSHGPLSASLCGFRCRRPSPGHSFRASTGREQGRCGRTVSTYYIHWIPRHVPRRVT
jgi:histidinol phosphatase-like PHP family hydrolase